MANNQQQIWLNAWYGKRKWSLLLLPLMWLFLLISVVRRFYLRRFAQTRLSVPVIVVGNISVGGTGKTPLLIALVKHLQAQGYNPGVISRGYGGSADYPLVITDTTKATESGDEPLSIFRQTGCAVCVDADRVAAAKVLVHAGCNILLSDDGLQHYRLGRSMEIVVIDGERGFGNGFCLPVGPLREPVERLRDVDLVVVNTPTKKEILKVNAAHTMLIKAQTWHSVATQREVQQIAGTVHAVAGIGNPQRFFNTLQELGLELVKHDFPDHHAYEPADFEFPEKYPVVMTEKDAVKCQSFAQPNWFYLAVVAELPESFWRAFDAKLAEAKSRLDMQSNYC